MVAGSFAAAASSCTSYSQVIIPPFLLPLPAKTTSPHVRSPLLSLGCQDGPQDSSDPGGMQMPTWVVDCRIAAAPAVAARHADWSTILASALHVFAAHVPSLHEGETSERAVKALLYCSAALQPSALPVDRCPSPCSPRCSLLQDALEAVVLTRSLCLAAPLSTIDTLQLPPCVLWH